MDNSILIPGDESGENKIEELNVSDQIVESLDRPLSESELRSYYSSKFQTLKMRNKVVANHDFVVLYNTHGDEGWGNDEVTIEFIINDRNPSIVFKKDFFDEKLKPNADNQKIVFLDELIKYFKKKGKYNSLGYRDLDKKLSNLCNSIYKKRPVGFSYLETYALIHDSLQLLNGKPIDTKITEGMI